ncbi:MAG: GNAT family N-acetyltransferase [Chloroflexota bacterium]
MAAASTSPEVEIQRAHLNLIESCRQLYELDPDAEVAVGPGWVFGAGRATHPVISNAAFRSEDGADPGELIARAQEFFSARGRGFSVWGRDGVAADRDLFAAAEAAGLQPVYEMPEMVLRAPVEEPPLPPGAELRRLTTAEQAADYWRVATASYASLGFPAEVFAGYRDAAPLLRGNVVAFLAHLDGEPVAIAMTIVSRGVAGIYWVGTLEAARGCGLGRAVTAAATNAGFALGAELASLQASPMGRPIYEAMGYETVFDYRMLMASAP